MAAFAQSTFCHAQYAAARPAYSQALYSLIFSYHQGQYGRCVDLGTGHGVVARALASHFIHVTGVDPSEGMLKQARALTPTANYSNVDYIEGPAESTSTIIGEDAVDMIVSAQAAHWFDYARAWPDFERSLKKGGTLAFWAYGGLYLQEHEKATSLILQCIGLEAPDREGKPTLDPYWPQPGSTIVGRLYRDIIPPSRSFEDVQRFEYWPNMGDQSKSNDSLWQVRLKLKIRNLELLMRSWSAVHAWQEAHPQQPPRQKQRVETQAKGDIIDMLLDEIKEVDGDFQDPEKEVIVEMPTGLLLARKK